MSNYERQDIGRLALLFGALSNPQRLQIFLHLATCCESQSCCDASIAGIRHCVGDLGRGLDLAASSVSHHIKELRRAGLLRVERSGQKIECWIDEDTVDMLATVLSHAGQGLKTQSNGGQSWTRTRRIARPPAAAKDPLGKGQRGVRAAPRRPARPASKR